MLQEFNYRPSDWDALHAGADGCGVRQPVVTNRMVPPVMREALNVESGLNDGICVPIVVLLLGLAVARRSRAG